MGPFVEEKVNPMVTQAKFMMPLMGGQMGISEQAQNKIINTLQKDLPNSTQLTTLGQVGLGTVQGGLQGLAQIFANNQKYDREKELLEMRLNAGRPTAQQSLGTAQLASRFANRGPAPVSTVGSSLPDMSGRLQEVRNRFNNLRGN